MMALSRRSFSTPLLALTLLTAAGPAAAQRRAQPSGARHATIYENPVFDVDFPDPTVVRARDGHYYVYATQGPAGGRVVNIQVARSRDLVRWEHLGDALPTKPAWASETQMFWAPHVALHGDTYYMYFSADPNARTGLCLAAATSKNPAGPFTDVGRPLKCGESFINIDPMSFDDPATGRKLLYWGSGFQPIRVQELADDRVSFKEGTQPIELVRADKNVPYHTLVEGAWVVRRGGWYYLFYSGENCCHGPLQLIKYAVMVARSRSATGPFETLAEATGAPDSVILRRGARWLGPGHNSVFTDARGRDWIAYHAIDAKRPYLDAAVSGDRAVRRVMLIDRVVWRGGWPRVERGMPSDGVRPAPPTRR